MRRLNHTGLLRASTLTSLLMTAALSLTGCLQDVGTVEGSTGGGNTGSNTPPDFVIPTPIPQPTPTPTPPPVASVDEVSLSLDGSSPTSSSRVRVKMETSFFYYMKLGFSDTCDNGEWVPIQQSAELELPKLNQNNTISVQMIDSDYGARTDCLKINVSHDNTGPQIIFKRYPAPTLESGATTEIEYEITDRSQISSVACSLNGVQRACPAAGTNVVSISSMPEGDYTFSIRARDALGNQSVSSVSWSVASLTRRLIQTFQMNDYRKVDVLIVIDNSGSMAYEQKSMASRVANFLSILRGLDWQIGVTTTDPRDISLGDGRLVPIYGTKDQYLFNSSMDETEAQRLLGLTLQRPETGSGDEQAIKTTYRAIERHVDGTAKAPLFREGAQFATLVISDEDESANGDKNDPHNLINFVSQTFGGQKNFSFHSIITRPGDTACRSTYGYAYGDRYNTLSGLTGGVIGSVCEADYAQQLTGIANGVRDLLKTLTLQCEPLSQYPISVSLDGQPYSASYVVEGVNLRFANELPPGEFTVDYRCLR